MWANENWTRRWDGSEHEVLIAQDYDPDDDAALVDAFARHFRDPRYIRIAGRPLLMVYRADRIPDAPAALARWRALFAERHGEAPLLVMAQSFGAADPREFGFDAAVEFPPHKLCGGLATRNAEMSYLDPRATAQVFAYDDVVAASRAVKPAGFPLIRTAVPGWDNDARRQGAGLVLHGATPARYQAWLEDLVAQAVQAPCLGEALVCVNAWNEWAEGAYLEPDVHFGAAFLNATGRAVTKPAATTRAVPREVATAGRPVRLLLVGHDAFAAGSQMLLLHLLRAWRAAGVEAEFLLLGGGALAADYAAAGPGVAIDGPGAAMDAALADWAARGFDAAMVNSAASAWAVPKLAEAGMAVTLLVHEMPRLLAEKGLVTAAGAAAALAQRIVFPAPAVRDAFGGAVDCDAARTVVMPQGCYRPAAFSAPARAALRHALGLDDDAVLVLGMGYADLRKGFDIFLQAWRAAERRAEPATPGTMFCWVGDIDPALRHHLAPEIAAAEATGRLRMAGFVDAPADWFSAADVLALTSREDPFASVVLEAMSAGLPCIAFAGAGGVPEMLERLRCGRVVPMADADAMAVGARDIGRDRQAFGGRARLARLAASEFGFAAYAQAVLELARPAAPEISVVVPSYNYARYLPERLGSIFAQRHPVAEVIVLDDASGDDSAERATATAAQWRRPIRLVRNPTNSGSVFAQWRQAAELAGGNFLWIAEADDAADPGFLAALAARLAAAPQIDLAFTDSRAIDAEGAEIRADHQAYYREAGAAALCRDGVFPAREFARRFLGQRNLILNASAVLWRRTALLAALARCGDELAQYRMAGDWRVYVELMAESDGQVAYVAAPLNMHRRHDRSVTAMLEKARHVAEIGLVQAAVRARLGLPDTGQAAYRRQVTRQLRALPAG